jgi:predicted RNA-binding Zn-ribbon protein involved in translation (DUF1610 family)
MYGRLDQVGQSLKCPDCGAQTVVPPPQPVKPKKQPAALEGKQYEVWGVDEAPSVAEMLAAQPKYIAVVCPMCETLMHATEKQVGKKLKCPDCGTAVVVPPPEEPAAIPSVLARDEEGYQLDRAADPGERPPVYVPPRRPMLYEEEREAELARLAAKQARGERRGPKFDADLRPIMPRFPLVTRILPFLFSPGTAARWLALSVGWIFAGGLGLVGVSAIRPAGGLLATQLSVIAGVLFFILGGILGMIWLAAASSILVAIVTESSEGNDQVQRWPGANMIEWLPDLGYVILACFVSPFPGWFIGRMITPDPLLVMLWFAGSLLVCFPVVLLSQLEVGSPFAVLSGKVLASLVRVPFSWALFYLEIGALAAFCLVATYLVDQFVPLAGVLLVPLYIGAMFIAARLTGRLGWKLSETLE